MGYIKTFELFEAKQVGVLYHYIESTALEDILKNDKMPPGKFEQPIPNYAGNKRGVSLTRLRNDNNMKQWYGNCIIEFDGNKLSDKYKIMPVDDSYLKYGPSADNSDYQGEEFVLAPRGIDELHKYVLNVYVPAQTFGVMTTKGRPFYIGDEVLDMYTIVKI